MRNPRVNTASRLYWASMTVLAPMPFLAFHAFLFGLWFYYPSALEIPMLLFFPVLWACMLRLSRFTGFGFTSVSDFSLWSIPTGQVKNHRLLREPHALFSFSGIAEVLFWYAVILGLYWHLHARFNFPASLKQTGTWGPFVLGYGVFFLASLLVLPVAGFTFVTVKRLIRELRTVNRLMARLASTFLLYILIDLAFSATYRLLSTIRPASFHPPIETTVDSIYFSTVTIATLGYGDFIPKSSAAKLLVVVEVLIGVFVLAAMISAAISITLDRRSQATREEE